MPNATCCHDVDFRRHEPECCRSDLFLISTRPLAWSQRSHIVDDHETTRLPRPFSPLACGTIMSWKFQNFCQIVNRKTSAAPFTKVSEWLCQNLERDGIGKLSSQIVTLGCISQIQPFFCIFPPVRVSHNTLQLYEALMMYIDDILKNIPCSAP